MSSRAQLLKAAMHYQPVPVNPEPGEEERVVELSSDVPQGDNVSMHIKLAALPDMTADPEELFAPASRGELIKIAESMERAQEVLQQEIVHDSGRIFFIMKSAESNVRVVAIDITDSFLRFAAL